MNNWEKALEKFLINWKNKKEVIGILVCGSYITGNPSKHSDIDLHIILSNKTKWRERGNKIVDGYLIEYFANPSKQIKKYFEEDYNNNSRMSHVQFVTGKILLDKTGEVKKLKIEANKWLKKVFKKLNNIEIEIKKYALWDSLDNLNGIYEKESNSFTYAYFNYLKEILEFYSRYIGQPINSSYKTYELLTEENVREKYLQREFPDKVFIQLFTKAMIETDKIKMIKHYEELTHYTINKMKGFEIDGWKIRSKLDV